MSSAAMASVAMSSGQLRTSFEILDGICKDLRARNSEDSRRRAAQRLRELVDTCYRDFPQEQFMSFFNAVNSRISTSLNHAGEDVGERLGAIYSVEALISFEGIDMSMKVARFAQNLKTVLRSKEPIGMQEAAQALGILCEPGGSLVTELVESEINTALEWLQSERVEHRRYAAVLVLRELARHAPTLVYGSVGLIFDMIFIGLRDPRQLIRATAGETVSACFCIIRERDPERQREWMGRMYQEMLLGLKNNGVEHIHGSLLVLRELLAQGGMFMNAHYEEACDIVYRFKDHREAVIKKTVVQLIPDLANYAPTEFTQEHLHKFMVHLSGLLKREKERNDAFLAIGNVAYSVRSSIAPYLDGVLIYVREGLSIQARKRGSVDPVFDCISRLALAVGQTLSKYMEALLDPIFECELSLKLTQALVDLAFYIPPVQATIQQRLLDILSKILCGEPFKPPGAPQTNTLTALPIIPKDPKDPSAFAHKKAEIKLALNTLGSFDFTGHVLNDFVRDVAIKYVEDDDPEIREAAALTCCQLYIADPIVRQSSHRALRIVGDIVSKLLTVGVGDPEPHIRLTVLKALDEKFDRHLSRAENIRTLFLAVNDEHFSIREVAIAIVGRVAKENPACIMPGLRKFLLQLLTDLKFSQLPRSKEESSKLISLLVQNGHGLVKPYVHPILKVLLPQTSDSAPGVAATAFNAIANLCTVAGEQSLAFKDQLMPLIITALHDQGSTSKREAALRTLASLASGAGYVVDPYLEYPNLLQTLLNIIRNEPQRGVLRQQAIKVVGIIGALDPYKHQLLAKPSPDAHPETDTGTQTDITVIMSGLSPSEKEYYPKVVINSLLPILDDPTLLPHHGSVVEAIMNIFRTLGLECVSFLDRVVPAFLGVVRNCAPGRLESYFSQLGILVSIVRQHIRVHLPAIVDVLHEFWDQSTALQSGILQLVEAIARALEGEFKIYLSSLVPIMLDTLDKDTSVRRTPSEKILHAFLVFGATAEEYMHLIIPAIIRVWEKPATPVFLKKSAVETIGKISRLVNVNDWASRIVHPLTRVLSTGDASLRQAALDTLCALIPQLGRDYLHYVTTVNKILVTHQIHHQNYELLVSKLVKGDSLPQDISSIPTLYSDPPEELNFADLSTKKLEMNVIHLKSAWDTRGKSTKEDWQEWIRRLTTTLLAESPMHALRACASLASVYMPLAKELFNSAFICCWSELHEGPQDELIQNIENAIRSEQVPADILGLLLNLAEFMEHDDKPLPIDLRVLGREASRCRAYAKALHYKELEFLQEQSSSAVEALIVLNNQLQQSDAAIGILRRAQLYKDGITLRETWFEKLEKWEEALSYYCEREASLSTNTPLHTEVLMGKMRCLHALGEWHALAGLAAQCWPNSSPESQRRIAPLATAAAWGMGKWDTMEKYLQAMNRYSPDRSFFGAILAVHRNQFREALECVQTAREAIDNELTTLVGESYNRSYDVVVRVQMLAELEELLAYKQCNDEERKAVMRQTWDRRLKGCQKDIEIWQRMLKLRALVMRPQDDMSMWIKFANLCRKANRKGLAEKSLKQLVGTDAPFETMIPYWKEASTVQMRTSVPIVLAALELKWQEGTQQAVVDRTVAEKTIRCLQQYTLDLAHGLGLAQAQLHAQCANFPATVKEAVRSRPDIVGEDLKNGVRTQQNIITNAAFLAKALLRQGQWLTALNKDVWFQKDMQAVLDPLQGATDHNPKSHKAWRAWALANYQIVKSAMPPGERQPNMTAEMIERHVLQAIQGFFMGISLLQGSTLQETLRILTLWFSYGSSVKVNAAIRDGFNVITVNTWLDVIPQLIARISQPSPQVQLTVHALLNELGKVHPQALVYPLTVTMKSWKNSRRSRSAKRILEGMRMHSPKLVDQAELVSHELIRTAVLWQELWNEGLEDASRLYFAEKNIEGMFATLEPLHDLLEKGPETLREISFAQAFGRDLTEAREWCKTYRTSKDVNDLNQAWDLYYRIFKRISRYPQLSSLELKYCSPALLEVRDLELAIPGTYKPNKAVVRIKSFEPTFTVFTSKQKPRQLTINGSDGRPYIFLLKGHEDIRQDERVMQLFGLCNTLLSTDSECFKRHLNIERYPAIPLSDNSGLLGWVPNSDTLHIAIKEYRESRRILLNIEQRIMLQMAPDFENLTLMQKVEVFAYALDNTTGQDLYRILWLKSRNSEVWLERRTNFTRSLAVMSMVGYILGLGDRHPSNLMLNRMTGKIIHIDFGDCFEVAMKRDKFPEKVPFRLTRMLTYAMEVSNIEGSFRITCEHVMRVLRDNKDSVMAVLEAFIHDPLVNWRLTNPPSPQGPELQPTHIIASDVNTTSTSPHTATGPTQNSPDASQANPVEEQNARAVEVLDRVHQKLTGHDFKPKEELDITSQVNKLILEATRLENLCQHFVGWCSFW